MLSHEVSGSEFCNRQSTSADLRGAVEDHEELVRQVSLFDQCLALGNRHLSHATADLLDVGAREFREDRDFCQ